MGTLVLAPTLPAKTIASRDWRDDSGGKGPAELAWGPEFRLLAPMSKAGHHSDHLEPHCWSRRDRPIPETHSQPV